jgi:hypothetical protein
VEQDPTPETSAPMDGWRLRKSTPDDFGGGIAGDADADLAVRRQMQRRLLCRACKAPITADEHRISIEGRHVHRRVNPFGIEFELGCFAAAPGAATLGEPTAEHSWFAGYAWSFACCGRCGEHLGWVFEGAEPTFHGLISNRLEEEQEAPET